MLLVFAQGYNFAKIIGDVDSAMLCGLHYCIIHFFGIPDLIALQKYMVSFFHQMVSLACAFALTRTYFTTYFLSDNICVYLVARPSTIVLVFPTALCRALMRSPI